MVSHSLIDIIRQKLDFLFFQQEKQLLRERLRSIESQDVVDLQKGLSHLLESVCEPIQASYAVLLVRQDSHYEQAAAYRLKDVVMNLPSLSLIADDVRPLRPSELPEPLTRAALLFPIYMGDQQAGALVLGAAEHGLAYSLVELDGLQEFSDYLGGWLGHLILERIKQPEFLPEFLKEELQSESAFYIDSSGEISIHVVELGLRNLHDYEKLAELPLARMDLVRQRNENGLSHIETGKTIHGLLCESVEMLRPMGNLDEKHRNCPPQREWYPYIILRDAYVKGQPNRDIMDRLYISEGTFNRTRRSAIRSVTRLLVDMEKRLEQ